MKKAVLYARLDVKHDDGEELNRQVKELNDYCKAKDYEVVRTIKYYNGRTVSSALLSVVAENANTDVLVIRDISRLCRTAHECVLFEQLLYEVDVELECVVA